MDDHERYIGRILTFTGASCGGASHVGAIYDTAIKRSGGRPETEHGFVRFCDADNLDGELAALNAAT